MTTEPTQAEQDRTLGLTASRGAIAHCEWCRERSASTVVELEPGRRLSAIRYKPPKTLRVCETCKVKVENLKVKPDQPVEVVRIN